MNVNLTILYDVLFSFILFNCTTFRSILLDTNVVYWTRFSFILFDSTPLPLSCPLLCSVKLYFIRFCCILHCFLGYFGRFDSRLLRHSIQLYSIRLHLTPFYSAVLCTLMINSILFYSIILSCSIPRDHEDCSSFNKKD